MPLPAKLRSLLNYLLLAAGGLFVALVALTALAYYIAVSDQERVPAIVEEAFRENFGAEATFGHYRFQYFDHFPFLSLALEDVVMRDPCFEDHGRELLRVKKVSAVFRPWKLLRREFELRSITVDSARVQLYRSIDGYFNAGFLEEDSLSFLHAAPDSSTSFSIDKIRVNGLYFDFQDALQEKRFRFEARHFDIGLSSSEQGRRLQLRGDWFFHGLHFKLENGPYFHNQESRLVLNVEWGGPRGGVRLLPSTMAFGKDTLHLEGEVEIRDTNYLRLAVSSPGILLENALPLFADNIRKSLQAFEIGRPVATSVTVEGPLLPGIRQPLEVVFQVDSTDFASGGLRLARAALSGRYTNNCNPSGPITAHSDCLDIRLDSAMLFDTIAFRATYHAEDMKAPVVELNGSLSAPLANLNHLLPPGQARFRSGRGEASFTLSGRMDNPLSATVDQPQIELNGQGSIRQASLEYLPRGLQLDNIDADFQFDEQDLALQSLRFGIDGSPFQLRGAAYGIMASLFGTNGPLFASLDVHTPHLDLGVFFSPQEQAGAVQPDSGPNNFMNKLEAEMRVTAESLSYRKLRASDVYFTSRLQNKNTNGNGPCLIIDSLSATAFDGIPVRASARLDELEDPVMDMALQLDVPLADLNSMAPPEKLRLKEGKLELKVQYQGRLRDYSGLDASALRGKLRGQAAITGASADYLPRGYEFRHFNGAFHFDGRGFLIDSLAFILNGNQASATGKVEGLLPFVFSPGNKLQAALNISTPELDLNRFPAGRRQEEGGKRRPASPNRVALALESALEAVEGSLEVEAEKLRYRSLNLDKVAFKGRLLPACEGQASANGCVVVEKLSARLFGTANFQARLQAAGLGDPFFVADVQVDMPLEELNRMFAPGQFQFNDGKVEVGFHYEGRPHGHFDVENALLKARLQGKGRITGGAFEYKPKGYRFTGVDTRFSFDEEDLRIEEIELRLNGNKLRGKGKFEGFLPFLFLPDRKLETTLEVSAGEFDFNKFKAPQKFLRPPGKPREPTVVTRLVNAGLENINAHLHLMIDSVKYRNFRATNVRGELTMRPGLLHFEDTEMSLCDGKFRLNGRIEGLEENRPDIDVQAKFQSADIRKVFQAFDNFGQQQMTSRNIEGRLNADVTFSARANANYDLLPASMKGQFAIKVEDGALIELPALDSIQSFLLRNRGLSNIQFATLENSFELRGQNLLVDHFFVASTALSFGVEGRYALGGDSDTNLLFEVPLANLFWQGKEVDDLEKLHKKKRGPAILLRATEKEEGGLNFKWVLSKGKE